MKNSNYQLNIIVYLTYSLAISIFFLSCDPSSDVENLDTKLLSETCWTSSFEENENNYEQTFRPCDYKQFPISRYRSQYQFEVNGVCNYLVLAPNDAHFFNTGKWSYDEVRKVISILDPNDIEVADYEVSFYNKDKLILTRK